MIENLPFYIVVVFIITTLLTVGIFQYAAKRAGYNSKPANFISIFLTFWLLFQATLSILGFYQKTDTIPPRLIAFAIFPAILGIIALFIFSKNFISRIPLKALTIIHIVRIPVEFVLLWLFQNGQVPQLMTFEGRNFDILTGISAPFIYWLAFRNGNVNRPLLLAWNIFGLILLANIVTHAALSLPSPIQQLAFEQPNRGVLYFPFIWLPSVIVPIVLFSHLVVLWQLLKKK